MRDAETNLADLVAAHERRLYGFFRARVREDAAASDLAQETWVEVLRHGDTFDAGKGSFWTFTRIWADFVLRRHWERGQKERERIALEPSSEPDEGGGPGAGERPDTGRPSPHDSVQLSRLLRMVLRCALACSRPPNEILVFGFTKLEWKPREITMNLSDEILRTLAARLEREYVALVPDPELASAFSPLREKLELSLSQILSDPRSLRAYDHVPAEPTGSLLLRAYFPPAANPDAIVTRWWDTVKRSVFRELRKESMLMATSADRAGPSAAEREGTTR